MDAITQMEAYFTMKIDKEGYPYNPADMASLLGIFYNPSTVNWKGNCRMCLSHLFSSTNRK